MSVERRRDRGLVAADDDLVVGDRVRRPSRRPTRRGSSRRRAHSSVKAGAPVSPTIRSIAAFAAAASVTPKSKTADGMPPAPIVSSSEMSVHGHGHVTVEPRRDVLGPADRCALGAEHLVEPARPAARRAAGRGRALDRREAAKELAQRGVLRVGRLEAHLEVEGGIGRDVRGARAEPAPRCDRRKLPAATPMPTARTRRRRWRRTATGEAGVLVVLITDSVPPCGRHPRRGVERTYADARGRAWRRSGQYLPAASPSALMRCAR